jgi:hypothetical protein
MFNIVHIVKAGWDEALGLGRFVRNLNKGGAFEHR